MPLPFALPARFRMEQMPASDDHGRMAILDRVAIGLSALCAAHCVTTAVIVAALASFGGVFLNPLIHELGLILAMILGAAALGTGVVRHGYMMPFATGCFGLGMMAGALSLGHGDGELIATLVGLMVLALGHDLNGRARS